MIDMEVTKKEIDVNENNIRHIVTTLYGLMAGIIALFISSDFDPNGWFLYLQLIGGIFVVVLATALLALIYKRKILFKELKEKTK